MPRDPADLTAARSGLWFLAVGGAASLTHAVVFALLEYRIWPEAANAAGFIVAFAVSFAGHRLLSFSDAGTSLATSFARYGATALGGFATNELVFVLLLRAAGWPSMVALVCAMAVAAVQTFVLGRFWAFRR